MQVFRRPPQASDDKGHDATSDRGKQKGRASKPDTRQSAADVGAKRCAQKCSHNTLRCGSHGPACSVPAMHVDRGYAAATPALFPPPPARAKQTAVSAIAHLTARQGVHAEAHAVGPADTRAPRSPSTGTGAGHQRPAQRAPRTNRKKVLPAGKDRPSRRTPAPRRRAVRPRHRPPTVPPPATGRPISPPR